MSSGGNVRVAIRIRPQNEIEKRNAGASALRVNGSEIDTGEGKRFTFDEVFSTMSEQDVVFKIVGMPVVDAVMQGFNGTVLAYGQTGSGKTHTMLGPKGGAPEGLANNQTEQVP